MILVYFSLFFAPFTHRYTALSQKTLLPNIIHKMLILNNFTPGERYDILGKTLLKGSIYMKKLIALLLVCVLILSMAACGKKNTGANDLSVPDGSTETTTGDTTATTEGTVSQDATEATEPSVSDDDATQEATKPTENDNKNDSSKEENTDIKVEINNGGNNGDGGNINLTPPDGNTDNSFVINFDDLMAASNK